MKSFSLDIPVLKETIAKLEISIKNIEKIGTDVENIGDKLISESWEGNATNSFKEHQQDWKKGYDEMVNQLIDFKDSLEKVVLAGAEEINEMALSLPVPLGGSQGTGNQDIISMEKEGIEELKAKCKTIVYEDYEEQREIMGTIENLSSKLNYSFYIGAAASKNKKIIEENQEKLQAFKGKLQNYEDRVLLFEQEVVDELSKYAVICGHKLESASFREVLKYQKDDNWKALLSKNVEELSDIEKLVLKSEYESGSSESVDVFSFDPYYKSPDNVSSNCIGIYNVGKYGYGYSKSGFNVQLKDGYAIIKGARSEFALKEGIKGTRYALKNAGNYTEVFQFVDTSTAVKSALNPKTLGGKLGYAGIAIGVGWDTYNNIENGADGEKIAADAIVDVGFGTGGIAASVAAGAFFGSIVPGAGTVVGAVVGLGVGLIYTGFTEGLKIEGQSIKDRAKEGLYDVLK